MRVTSHLLPLFSTLSSHDQYTTPSNERGILLCLSQLKRRINVMSIHLGLTPLLSLVAGVLILVMPRLLNMIVAVYLIVIGLIGLVGPGGFRIY